MSRAWRAAALALAFAVLAIAAEAKPKRVKARPLPRFLIDDRTTCQMISPEERDLIIRTVMGEANNEPFEGKVGVAAVIKNRMLDGGYGGRGAAGVVLKPKQFEPWSTRRSELLSYSPSTRGWSDAERAVDEAFGGNDPTGGATHFANVGTVRARGNGRALAWLNSMGNRSRIGQHTFGNADGEGRSRPSRAAEVDDTPRESGGHDSVIADLFRDDPAENFDFGDFSFLDEPTDDPRRLAVRSMIHEILDDLLPPAGQGHAVAPVAGAVVEDEGELI